MDHATVAAALGLWPETAGGYATLVNLSENHTFRIDAPAGRFMLRVHRPGYQSRDTIESELAWVAALRGVVPRPDPLPGSNGELLQRIGGRDAVLFAFVPGVEPSETGDLVALFSTLGGYAAQLHRHVDSWPRPPRFTRPLWSAEAILDPGPWGDWRAAPHVAGATRTALDGLDARLRAALAAYGQAPHRFGLIHADMRLANLLVDGDAITLIDFDDCGFGWFIYDLAASLSFIETRADLPALVGAWLEAYAALRPLTAEDRAIVGPMILLRRFALLAWIGSHGETALAQRHAATFAHDTVELALRLAV